MRSFVILLCIALVIEGCSMVSGLPWESLMIGRRCKCLKQTGKFNPKFLFRRIQIIPENVYCRKREILIFLENQNVVCVDPEAQWVQLMIFHLRKRHANNNENQT